VQPFPHGLTHLRGYFDRLVERPSVQRVLEEARPYLQLYPFVDAVPKRFL
jgi:glutathione S-transferase